MSRDFWDTTLDTFRYFGDVDSHAEFIRPWHSHTFAEEVFTGTDPLEDLLEDERDLCIGVKGSGKSMLYQMLVRHPKAAHPERHRTKLRTVLFGILKRYASWFGSFLYETKSGKTLRILMVGMDLRDSELNLEKAHLERTGTAACGDATESHGVADPMVSGGTVSDAGDRGRSTASLRDAWLRVIARCVLRGLAQKKGLCAIRGDVVLLCYLAAVLCAAVSFAFDVKLIHSFGPVISAYSRHAFPILLGVLLAWPILTRILRRCGIPVWSVKLVGSMQSAGVARGYRLVPALWHFIDYIFDLPYVIERIDYKGLIFSPKSKADATDMLRDANDHLRAQKTVILLLVDNIEHVVNLRDAHLRTVLAEEFFAVMRGFRETYDRIRIKVFLRTDIASLSSYADRTQLATRYVHLKWHKEKVWEVCLARFAANDDPWRAMCEVRPEQRESTLFGSIFPATLEGSGTEWLLLPESLRRRKGESLGEVLSDYVSDGLGGIDLRFVIWWVTCAMLREKGFVSQMRRNSGRRTIIGDRAVLLAFQDLLRFVRDEVVTDYHYLLPRLDAVLRISRNRWVKRDDVLNALAEGKLASGDSRVRWEAEKRLRELFYHGLIECCYPDRAPEFARRMKVCDIYADALCS